MLINSAKIDSESETQKVVSWLAAAGGIIISSLPLILTGWIGGTPKLSVEPFELSKSLLTIYSGIAAIIGVALSILVYSFRHSLLNTGRVLGITANKQGKKYAVIFLIISFAVTFLAIWVRSSSLKGFFYIIAVLSLVSCIEITMLVIAIERDSSSEQTLKWELLNQAILSNFLAVETVSANKGSTNQIEEIHIRVLKKEGVHVIKITDSVSNPHINYTLVSPEDKK